MTLKDITAREARAHCPAAINDLVDNSEPDSQIGQFSLDQIGMLYNTVSDYGGTCTVRWTGTEWEEVGLDELEA